MIGFSSPLHEDPLGALRVAAPHAPYLKRLLERETETVLTLGRTSPAKVWNDILQDIRSVEQNADADTAMQRLRAAKRQAHLILAAADLSGVWPLSDITDRLTAFADASVAAALSVATKTIDLSADGLFIIALGKMGARELNYSSDIDVAAFYDPEVFEGGKRGAADSARRIVQHMCRILSDQTADGYVLRTDLRLRPDPGSTPVAVSTRMAEQYYESVGQNWERMVWIKARPCAGDLACADVFVRQISPFIWRRHLDYWAINDIHAIKAMINSSTDNADLEDPDVKLGPGGIREIEFFAQTQQLIMGGRDPRLRVRATLSALERLQQGGLVSADDANELSRAYSELRAVEHRIQMRQDEQTHRLPTSEQNRSSVAALCGIEDFEIFDRGFREVRARVHQIYLNLFDTEARQKDAARSGNLVFTGVDPDPGTLETLSSFGFSEPENIISNISDWHRGRFPATRTERGRELLTALLPGLLNDMADTGDADTAFQHFQSFLGNLSSGVQTLSMLLAERELRRDLIATLALAPRLARRLGRRPELLEALLAPEEGARLKLDPELAFEDAMDEARRYVRETEFLTGHRLLHGHLTAKDAGQAYSALADQTISAMAGAAEVETARRFGQISGDWCVVALGKLGGQALTATSDLDIMVIYDSDDTNAPVWFTRFTQRLITALSAETAEGQLYEVDMRLRPSGRSGPVAVKLSSFERYHRDEAWTWEHMALTRLRPVSDQNGLAEYVVRITQNILVDAPRRDELTEDIRNMRQRLAAEKPGHGLWDLKLGEGGLVDLEFIVQRELLMLKSTRSATPHLIDAIQLLKENQSLSDVDQDLLLEAEQLLSALQQIQRLALPGDISSETISAGLKDRLAKAAAQPDFEAVESTLRRIKAGVQTMRRERIGAIKGESLLSF
ncbi:MAG: bifunctional [glutamine synthetase] adenylyltransferase/[glutamine synthetase]-adenylyl-L-tyrosine phosphorylase [Pseudomonadota bacterium]